MKLFSIIAIPLLSLFLGRAAPAETLLLKSGEKYTGEIIITYNKGILFREREGAPGHYHNFDEVSRISTEDGLLYYLMPRSTIREKKGKIALFPFARTLRIGTKHVAPTPYVTLPVGTPVRVKCIGVEDAVTLELDKGITVRLLGLSPPPASAGEKTGRDAADYLSGKVKGKELLLFPGPQGARGAREISDADAYVVADNELVNAAMLARGWARVADSPGKHPYKAAFISLEKFARGLGRGFWAPPTAD